MRHQLRDIARVEQSRKDMPAAQRRRRSRWLARRARSGGACAAAGLLSALFLTLVTSTLSTPGFAQSLVRELTIPAPHVRALLPADGEVLSHTISKNTWPNNEDSFERNETLELSLGRGIRAKKSDRDSELSLSPGLTFHDGYIVAQGGWRMHKRVSAHPDYFDGLFRVSSALAYVDKKVYVSSDADLSWRPSFVSLLAAPIAAIATPLVTSLIESDLERRVNQNVALIIEEKINALIGELKLSDEARSRVVADITQAGLRLRLFDRAVHVLVVPLPNVAFKPPLVAGDSEFGGNGPHVTCSANLSLRAESLILTVTMDAQETRNQGSNRKWTRAKGEVSAAVKIDHGNPIAILGQTSWSLCNQIVDGHEPITIFTPIGPMVVHGDRRGNDAGEYTGVDLRPSGRALVLVGP